MSVDRLRVSEMGIDFPTREEMDQICTVFGSSLRQHVPGYTGYAAAFKKLTEAEELPRRRPAVDGRPPFPGRSSHCLIGSFGRSQSYSERLQVDEKIVRRLAGSVSCASV